MKKVLFVVMTVLLLVCLCACSYVPSTRFMSRTQVKSLVKEFGTPQAEVTLSYEVTGEGGKTTKVEVTILYDLLLSKTPLATIRFIQLAREGFYDESLVDTYNSTYKYAVMGRYAYRTSEKSGKSLYYLNNGGVNFKGEFKSNGYGEPDGGYAQFSMFALAMYHDDAKSDISNNDMADGALIFALANQTLNSDNYAVFAEMVSVTLKNGDSDPITYVGKDKAPSQVRDNIASFTGKTSRDVYDDATEARSTKISFMSTRVMLHVTILGDYNWSKLPSIGK